jgi:hypothetical protein
MFSDEDNHVVENSSVPGAIIPSLTSVFNTSAVASSTTSLSAAKSPYEHLQELSGVQLD